MPGTKNGPAALEAAGRAVVFAFHTNPFDETLRYDNGPSEPVLRAIVDGADGSVSTHPGR